jgi:predicted ABC-type ATPase
LRPPGSVAEAAPRIYVLAGTNGAGKSSIAGATVRASGAEYFNPDEAAQRIRAASPGMTQTEANSLAWLEGKRLLERAIAERLDYAFETTLGGDTITQLLERALDAGIEVRVWYTGLSSPELHIARVRARVVKGGHDIPKADIRRRYVSGQLNLIRLLPRLSELRVYDNSEDADPSSGLAPAPKLVLHVEAGEIMNVGELAGTPEWAKPIVAAAMKLAGS